MLRVREEVLSLSMDPLQSRKYTAAMDYLGSQVGW
jgi:hypothetical protein